jgi:cysteine-rich repeat protein
MRYPLTIVAAAIELAALLGVPVGRANATTETYLFRDSFAPNEGAGNVLVPVSNATGTIVTGGPDFVNGAFVDETISSQACAETPTIRAWSFPDRGGLRYDNAAPTLVTGSYSISMLMRYNPMDDTWARLIDFSNSTQDAGIYKYSGGQVSFYPVGYFAAGSFVQDQDVFVTITRDAATQLVSLYINGVPSGTYVDTTNLYAPLATVVYFLMDNTTGSAAIYETDPGVIAYLQVTDAPMTAEDVAANLAAICGAVACGDGIVSLGEECDDHNVVPGDGCSATCTVEECWQCTGKPSTCTPLDANTPCAADGDPCTLDVCDGSGTCGVPVDCSSSTTTSTTITTTSSSTSSTAATSTSTTHASTSTTHASTTTTTVPGDECADTPVGPTFPSIRCRLDALGGRVEAESGLGGFQSKLADNLTKAASITDEAESLCDQGNLKKTKKRLQQAAKALTQYTHRLAGHPAKKKLDPAIRQTYANAGAAIGSDLKALRAQVHCPAS